MCRFKSLKKSIFFTLAGHLLLGIGHIAFLPPWEGFDETAHYSSIQQIADAGILPRYDSARISRDVEEYKIKPHSHIVVLHRLKKTADLRISPFLNLLRK